MQTVSPDSKRFRREMSEAHRPVFRSTIFPVDRSLLKGSNIEGLVDEMKAFAATVMLVALYFLYRIA
jgi:hypothetical protein